MLIVWTGMSLIAIIQIPTLINKKQWRELICFAILWIIAGVYASFILGTFTGKISIINHSEIIRYVFTTLLKKLSL